MAQRNSAWRDRGAGVLPDLGSHLLDTAMFWFGDPAGIFCSTRPDPRTTFPHTDGICTYILEYSNGLRCVSIDDTWTGPAKEGCPAEIGIQWRIEGLNGLAIGELGWCKDPYTSASTLRYAAKGDRQFHEPRWTETKRRCPKAPPSLGGKRHTARSKSSLTL